MHLGRSALFSSLLSHANRLSLLQWIMLAKSRSDALARRAALSAPAGYLSRLLLCSGLPCASLLTMIDRLGRLGVATESKDDVYVKLLAPSASSEWDVGRAGHNRDISRKLLGRLSAYLRLHTVSLQGENSDVSTIFLVWLSDYCKSNHDMIPNKAKNKKSKISENQFLTSLTSASSVLLRIQNDSMTLTSDVKVGNLEMDILNQCEMPSLPTFDFDVQRNAAGSFIASCMKVNRYIFLDEWLYGLLSKLNKKAFELETQGMLTELAVDLLKAYQSLSHAQNGATVILIKWLPRLSRNAGKPELWESIFKASTDPSRSAVLNILLTKCLTSWSMPHVAQCKDWIMTLDAVSGYDYERIALFLISTSEQPSPQIEMFSESYGVSLQSQWASSKEFVIFATAIAIRSLMQSRAPLEKALSRRNRLPTGFTLLFLLARCGKKQLRSVSNLILEDLAAPRTEDTIRNALEVVFLRLYLCFPHWMDLGSVAAREALMNASERQSQSWSHWRSSYDDKISGMLDALSSGEVRVTKSLSELSRKQPLFVLRELPKMTDLLQTDAAILSDDQRERKGVITGRDMSGDLVTVLHGKVVKMTVQHWGYSFTEPLWTSLLDVLAAMPREVLFSCGLKVGLMDFLTIYLELLSVQLQLMSAHSAARLKGKLDDFFIMFRQINLKGWQQWLGSKTDESEVHHLLVSCNFISPEEAIESRKNGNYIH